MITQTRRRLLMAARSLHNRGVLPPGVEDADVFSGARSGYLVSDDKTPLAGGLCHGTGCIIAFAGDPVASRGAGRATRSPLKRG